MPSKGKESGAIYLRRYDTRMIKGFLPLNGEAFRR